MNVLIVIEEPKFREALDAFLRSESVAPVTVASLDEARDALSDDPFDLIFASEKLDELDIEQTHDAIRSLPHSAKARLVAVSLSRAPALRPLYEAGYDAIVGPASTADEIAAQAILAARARTTSLLAADPSKARDDQEPGDSQEPRTAGKALELEDLFVTQPLPDLDTAELSDALSARAWEILGTLKTLGYYLAHGAPAERQAQHALHAVNILLPNSPAAIWLRPDQDHGLVLVPGSELPDEYPEIAQPYYANLNDTDWEELSGDARFIPRGPRERGVTGPLVSMFTFESIQGALHIGISASDRMLGLLAVYFSTPDRPDTHDVIALESIASMTAVAMTHETEPRESNTPERAAVPAAPATLPWESTFEHYPDAACLIDGNGLFVATNRALSSLSGVTSKGMRLLGIFDMLDERDTDNVSRCLSSMIERDTSEPECLPVNVRRAGMFRVPMSLMLRALPVEGWNGVPLVLAVLRETSLDAKGAARLESLQDIARVVATERDVETSVNGVLEALSQRFGYPRAVVWTTSRDGSTLRRLAALTDDVPDTSPAERGVAGRVLRSWLPEVVSGPGGLMCVPIVHADLMLGVLEIRSGEGDEFHARDESFFASIAAQIAGIIERDNLYQHLEHQALTDVVTGLPNRQAFQQGLDQAVASLGDDVVSVLVLGVDGFKNINELYGHVIADDVLRQIGSELKGRVDPGHMLARYTSDQFGALLPGVNRDDAVIIAEKLRIALATHLFTVAEQVEQLTVSIGAATCPDDAGSSQALLQAADHAMYLAKRAGRNQTFQSNAAFATLAPAHGRINDLLRQAPRETLSLLIRAMDQRMPERAGHSERVTRYALAIAREMGLPDSELPRLRLAAYIHDIGMVSLPDSLLRKPSQLSEEERGLLRGVPVAAHGLLSQLDMHESVLLSVLHQHENFDGTGYPTGLRGESIPLGARIIAVADALDAMTSARAHREPMTLDQAQDQVNQQANRQFDPDVVKAAFCLTDVISEPVTVSPRVDGEWGEMISPISRGVTGELRG